MDLHFVLGVLRLPLGLLVHYKYTQELEVVFMVTVYDDERVD